MSFDLKNEEDVDEKEDFVILMEEISRNNKSFFEDFLTNEEYFYYNSVVVISREKGNVLYGTPFRTNHSLNILTNIKPGLFA